MPKSVKISSNTAEQAKPNIIAWDFDDTVGNFRGMRTQNPEYSHITLRYGMHELLGEFSEKNGYRHIITSAASGAHINEGLRRTFLDKKFDKIYDRDAIEHTVFGKRYQKVEPDYSLEEKSEKMLVIGDGDQDKPLDVGGMVFVNLGPQEEQVEALVIREILTSLLDKGDGDFNRGFEKLYSKAKSIDPDDSNRKKLQMSEDISFIMEYQAAPEAPEGSQKMVPVIRSVRSKGHMKPFQPF